MQGIEQEHLNTINQLLSGNVPSVSNQQGGNSAGQQQPSQQQMNTATDESTTNESAEYSTILDHAFPIYRQCTDTK